MKSEIIEYLNRYVETNAEEEEIFESSFNEVIIKKGQHIILPDFVAKYRSYVLKGAFRAYVLDKKGNEHTISFAIEDWWISDVNSYIYQQPATMFVAALENSIVLQLEYTKEQELKKSNHKFETFFRIIAERSAAFHQRRIISNLMFSAEERYDHFIEKYPAIVKRVPQYALASYLDMTTQFLSRIRKGKTHK
ncbi:cyclic nucleotide-binding domain-containing protein [Flavobacterium sp. MC2016-06]|jgi:CRP-like cAMP-binding protein|uniref:Crp/Fnr family transcriptional regulator n=1 Tax=Flavobacterium sp. MC2016-06 TaxID=2676308 RepID=UPI0012BABBCC|nr:cyclic nucleotide-binding domain-containing protein [Flavobacterium sp. MC2016-06]MBU3861022.1 Crp/Fnr family transcriptional regulator [Flavobacterium sp. MC2016-06]